MTVASADEIEELKGAGMDASAPGREGKLECLNKNGRKREDSSQGGCRRKVDVGDGVVSDGESRKKMVVELPRGVDVGEPDGVADLIFFGGGRCRK